MSSPDNSLSEFISFDSIYGINISKEILYQKIETKIELFEKCIDEVG